MKVKELLSDESKWTKGEYARKSDGTCTDPRERFATCWCIEGAIFKCYEEFEDRKKARRVLHELISLMECDDEGLCFSLIDWNDTHTFADIRRVLELADV